MYITYEQLKNDWEFERSLYQMHLFDCVLHKFINKNDEKILLMKFDSNDWAYENYGLFFKNLDNYIDYLDNVEERSDIPTDAQALEIIFADIEKLSNRAPDDEDLYFFNLAEGI